MDKIIKYKRFFETHDEKSIQDFFDKLIMDGLEIIHYEEHKMGEGKFQITAICAKRQKIL